MDVFKPDAFISSRFGLGEAPHSLLGNLVPERNPAAICAGRFVQARRETLSAQSR